MRSFVYCLLLAVVVTTLSEARPLTEEEFLSGLRADHPALIALEGELGQAVADEKSASLLANPDLRLEREAWGEVAQQTTMTLGWAPPLLGGRGARVNAGRFAVEAARSRVDALRLQSRSRARASYAAWWVATERLRVLTRQSARVERIVEGIRNRAARGEESGLTARRFELASLRVQANLALAEVNRYRRLAEVQAWSDSWEPDWEPAPPILPANPDSLRWETRPEFLALQAGLLGAEHKQKAAGQFLQFPSLEFGWVWLEGDAQGIDGPWAGLVWNVPLFDRNQPARTRAKAELRSAHAEMEIGERRFRAELSSAVSAYETVQGAARRAWESTADLDALSDAALASFQAGESTDTDLLEVLRSILEARLSALQLYSEALGAHRALEEAAGKPLTVGASR